MSDFKPQPRFKTTPPPKKEHNTQHETQCRNSTSGEHDFILAYSSADFDGSDHTAAYQCTYCKGYKYEKVQEPLL